MKYFLIVLFFGIVGLFIFNTSSKKGVSKSCPEINADSQIIVMKKDSFQPETLTIQKCTKVVFENQDNVSRWPASNLHPTHGIYPEFDPRQPVEAGKDWFFVFEKIGSWRYHDHLAPSMRGTIIVE